MRLSILCFFLIISSLSFSQKKTNLTDQQYLELQDKTRLFINSNLDSAFVFANQIQQSDNYIHKVFALGAKSYLYQIERDSVKSKHYYAMAYKLLEKVPSGAEKLKNEAYLLNFGGLSEWKRFNYSKALDCFLEGKKQSKKTGDLIQAVKFNNNIALINSEVGNFKLAIKTSKEMDALTNEIEYLYTDEQFIRSKSNINLNLGTFYEKYYVADRTKKYLLDSAEYYYKKALNYSKDITMNKINAKINMGNIYYEKKNLPKAKSIYQEVLFLTKQEPNLIKEYFTVLYDLGSLCFEQKKYDESLVYFQKVDSIYKINKIEKLLFANSNYYQAKIYNIYGDAEKAIAFSKAYVENYEENEHKLNNETFEVNLKLNHQDVKKEMIDIQKKYKNEILLRYLGIGLLILLFVLLFFIKNKRDKNKINERVNAIVETYKQQQLNSHIVVENSHDISKEKEDKNEGQVKREGISISIDEEKENEILEKLAALENKLYYLKPDFTQQTVAKKIKTNTTYLSYVVNKKFNKTFSEYSNELKINFAINEIINNTKYREYSTQAIAESVGFKNAGSFANSFRKKTGVTPYQFINEIKKGD